MNMNINKNSKSSASVPCALCQKCRDGISDTTESSTDTSSSTNESRCISWLEQCTISDTTSVCGTGTSDSTYTTESDDENCLAPSDVSQINVAGMKKSLKENHFQNIQITNCRNPIVGSVTNFYGPVSINQIESVVNRQTVTNQIFLDPPRVVPRRLFIADRRSWLAQPPLNQKEYLEKPAKYVIICHTATEEGMNQSDNMFLVRTIQSFHIESKKWNDIAYNFLIGSDGNVYEGRGWSTIGSHTFGYNNISIGLAFVGCFMNKLPPQIALRQAKALIKDGVENGHIDREYRLVSHCQCRPFESPGKQLHDEIKTWDNWYDLELFEDV